MTKVMGPGIRPYPLWPALLAAGKRLLLGAVCLLPALGCAEDAPPPAPRFDGPRVTKLDWATANLVSADFDGDGRNDLALLNNGQARIELLYQLVPGKTPPSSARPVSNSRWEPVLEDAPFQKASIVTGQSMHALAASDFNGDGLPDVAYTNDQGKLVFRFQAADQSWNEKLEVEVGDTLPYDSTLRVADVNKDGKADLLLLAKKNLHLLIQGRNGPASTHLRFPLGDPETSGIQYADLDGDGREDIFHLGNAQASYLVLRRQLEDGTFAREELLDLGDEPRSLVLPYAFPAAKASKNEGESAGRPIVRIQDGTGLVEVSQLKTTSAENGIGIELPLFRYAVPSSSWKTPAFALGDFAGEGQGAPDIAVADGEGAQIWILESRGTGSFGSPISIPTYSGVNDLAPIETDGDTATSELLVLSQREKTLGIMSRAAPGEPLRYPEPLPCEGTPLAAAVLAQPDTLRIACVVEDKSKRDLLMLERKEGQFSIAGKTPLPEVSSKPKAVRAFDFNQDGLQDLLIFSPDEPLRVLLQEKDGSFASFSDTRGLSGSLVDKLDPSSVTFYDVDGDGKEEALIARKRFVRALRIGKDRKVEVVSQFNAENEQADLVFAVLLPGDVHRPLLAYDAARARLVRAERDDAGVYREKAATPLKLRPNTSPRLVSAGTGANKEEELLLIAPTEVYAGKTGSASTLLSTISSYETDLQGVAPSILATAELAAQQPPQLILLDSTKTRVLEILSPPLGAEPWRSLMHFAVFNQDPHYRGKTGSSDEPHDMLIVDVTGDGKADIVLLAHDRLLVYTSR